MGVAHLRGLADDYLFKLLLIGDSGVGKSCLLLRFAVRRLSCGLGLCSLVFCVFVSIARCWVHSGGGNGLWGSVPLVSA